jgi:hypothetical protein
MNVKRTLVIGVMGGALAVWLAAAATSTSRSTTPVAMPRTGVIDASGAQLAAEVARLHERMRPTDTPLQTRDLFRYARRPSGVRRLAPEIPAPVPVPEARPDASPAAAQLKLVGIAEDVGDSGPIRTAVVSGFGELFLVKEGEAVTLRYRVSRISSEAVELIDVTDNTTVRLALK